MHQSSMKKMALFRKKYLKDREKDRLQIMDLGSCDVNGSYKPLFDAPKWIYKGIDLSSGPNVDIVLKHPYFWHEIRSHSADVIISGQAFEHIEFFWITMLEINRILKCGGLCCIIAPSAGTQHRYPVDCWRFYPDGFAALSRFAKLETLDVSTQWDESSEYTDCSNHWRDTVLVCRKPITSKIDRWFEKIRRIILYRVWMQGILT